MAEASSGHLRGMSHRTVARIAIAALGATLTASLAAVPAIASPAAAPPPVAQAAPAQVASPPAAQADPAQEASAPASRTHREERQGKDLVLSRYRDDGVKGTIRNFTDHSVKVAELYGGENVFVLIPPGGQVTFYNSRKFEYRDGYKLLLSGHGANFTITRAGDGATRPNYLTLSDPYVGRPDTYFDAYPIKTLRTGWSQNESHHEVTPTSSFWVKREKDGWNGGHETSDTGDWAVFTVHIDKI